ncbi:MAG: hypothetical protein WDA16_03130 [Candidatus Thermoplasmatota archaeon]
MTKRVAFSLLLATVLLVLPNALAAPVDVDPTGDADVLAVSGTGNATNSGTDNACVYGYIVSAQCIAASGTGTARNAGSGSNTCAFSNIVTVQCVAISVAGEAENACSEDTGLVYARCVSAAGYDLLP